jgi:hypothetical protein
VKFCVDWIDVGCAAPHFRSESEVISKRQNKYLKRRQSVANQETKLT